MLQQSPGDPDMLLLAGKSAFMLGDFKKATDLLERATAIDGTRNQSTFTGLVRRSGVTRRPRAS